MKFKTLTVSSTPNDVLALDTIERPNPGVSIIAKFKFNTSNPKKVDSLTLYVTNTMPNKYSYDLHNAHLCCNIILGANNVYFLNYNFLEVKAADVKKTYTINVNIKDGCPIILENSHVIFPKVNTEEEISDFKDCPTVNIDSIPETKDGSIIIGI